MSDWKQVTDVRAFLAERGRKVRHAGHVMTKRVAHWPYCARCGLVALKNDVSRKAVAGECIVHE